MAESKKLDGIFFGEPGRHDFFDPTQQGQILSWLIEAAREGEMINDSDDGLSKIDDMMSYVMGEQDTASAKRPRHPEIRRVILNRTKKAIRDHVSALTDLKPLFAWKTGNDAFKRAGNILNQYTSIWWINTFADLELADAIRYSLVGGSGDLVAEFDPTFHGGDTHLMARDPRDTLAIRPTRERSIQSWEGVTLRESHSVNKLLAKFPGREDLFQTEAAILSNPKTQFRTTTRVKGTTHTLSGLGAKDPNRRSRPQDASPSVTLFRTFLEDRTTNLSNRRRFMGTPGSNWGYNVEPGGLLYPYKRLIVWTERGILYDGPNPYWHGLYPVARLKLDPWPWSFHGLGLMNDLKGGQDAINFMVNDILQLFSQTVNRGSVWDKQMPANEMKRFDPREPNWKVKRPNAYSKGFELAEVPDLPQWALPFLQHLIGQFDDMAGVANLRALMQLRQMPAKDTIEKYTESLTSEIRLEGRQVEAVLRDLAQILKSNLFQFQTTQRRFNLLGDAGRVLEDLDYNPDTIIPSLSAGDPGYSRELDKKVSRHERARFFTGQFNFYVTPHSMLAMQAQDRKMMYFQLARQGYMDFWTLMEMMEVPNVGTPPVVPLPPLEAPSEPPAPDTEYVEYRIPATITERLIAQQKLGIGQQVSPAGRKASGQESPHMIQRKDGSSTVAESR